MKRVQGDDCRDLGRRRIFSARDVARSWQSAAQNDADWRGFTITLAVILCAGQESIMTAGRLARIAD